MATRMQSRRGTSAQWAAANPVLADGEIGYAKDTRILKIGDGSTAWNQLATVLDGAFLGINSKAANAEQLDGLDSTAFLKLNDGPPLKRIVPSAQSASLTLAAGNEATLLYEDSTSNTVITIPTNTSAPLSLGYWVDVAQWNTGTVTITAPTGVTLIGMGISGAARSVVLPGRFSVFRLVKVAINTWLIYQLTERDTGWIDIPANAFMTTHWSNWNPNTVAPNIGGTINSSYRVKNNLLYVRLYAQYINATAIAVGTDGGVADFNILNTAALPTITAPIHFPMPRNGVYDAMARLNIDGSVQFVSATPGAVFPQGSQLAGAIMGWPVD